MIDAFSLKLNQFDKIRFKEKNYIQLGNLNIANRRLEKSTERK